MRCIPTRSDVISVFSGVEQSALIELAARFTKRREEHVKPVQKYNYLYPCIFLINNKSTVLLNEYLYFDGVSSNLEWLNSRL
jgi:hypothetical protein